MRRDGRLEPPRATDPDDDGWDLDAPDPCRTEGFVVDHAAAVGLSEGIGPGRAAPARLHRRPLPRRRTGRFPPGGDHPPGRRAPSDDVPGGAAQGGVLVDGDRQHSTPQRRRSTSGPRRSSWHAAGPTNSSCAASGSR
nr:DUF5954 family protein [Streptomyces sp. EN27]